MNTASDKTREISRRELLKMASPLGRVTLNKETCTGCGLCVPECPTGALTLAAGEAEAYRIVFKHGLCVACGQCVEICPEQCLKVERTLETSELDSPAVLFDDEIVRCTKCGAPFASRAMINSIKARLPESADPAQFELCPDCKARSFIGLKSK